MESDVINFMMNKKTSTFLMFLIAATVTITSQSVITTGLKYLMDDFGITSTTAQLTYSVFLLVMGVMIPFSAYITHKFKVRQVLLTALLIFIVGSTIAVISSNIWILILGRILEAISTGIIMPMTQILLFKIIPEEKWHMVMGLFGLIVGMMPAMGPTIGGYIIDLSNWRIIFLILAILSTIIFLLSLLFVRYELETEDYPLDFKSLILSILFCVGIMYGFSNITEYGLSIIYVILPIIIGVISLTIFINRQKAIEKPLINLSILKSKYFVSGTTFISLLFFTMCSINVIMPLFVQNITNYSATTSGLVLLPSTIIMILFNFIGAIITNKIGIRRILILSCIFSIIGYISMMTYTMESSVIYMVITQIIRGIGAGLGLTPATTWAMSVVSYDVEDATAVNNTLRQIFGAIGSSISVVLLTFFANGSIEYNLTSVNAFKTTSLILAIIILISLIIVLLNIREINIENT